MPAKLPKREKGKPLVVLPSACVTCPYRRDTPSGLWDRGEYEKLRLYDTGMPSPFPMPDGTPVNIPVMAVFWCHQSTPAEKPIACRGWLSTHREHAAVNLGIMLGAIKAEDIPTEDETETYYATGTEACNAGLRDIDRPSRAARAAVAKLVTRGAGRFDEEKTDGEEGPSRVDVCPGRRSDRDRRDRRRRTRRPR